MRRHCALVLIALCATASGLRSQNTAQALAGARQQIDELNWDSAATLLGQVLRGAPDAPTRVRAFTLLGITQLSRNDRVAARGAFEQALRLDASLKVDSLADLATDVRVVFNETRTALGISDAPRAVEAPRLTLTLDVPADTTLPAQGGRLRIETRPSYRARVVTAVTPADNPGLVIWSDTQLVGGIRTGSWNLRGRDGVLVAPGRYTVRATASDSIGQVSPTIEHVLVISRVAVDTAPMPVPLTASAFAPETLQLRHGSPTGLLAGLVIAGAAAFVPSALGNSQLTSGAGNGGAYAVAGAVSVATVVGFLNGHRAQPLPENALSNQQLRTRDAAERQRIAQVNQQARDRAPVRVRVEGP